MFNWHKILYGIIKDLGMENIFKNLGFNVSQERITSYDQQVSIFIINNSDGTPRWIWNTQCKQPLFLKFYNIGSKKASIFSTLIKLIFWLKLQKIFFKKKVLFFEKGESLDFNYNDSWAIFTGTIGPNNKAILYSNGFFYKIATTENAQKLIQNEHEVLKKLAKFEDEFVVPESKYISPNIIQLTDIAQYGIRANEIAEAHLVALNKMSEIENKTILFKNWESFQELKTNFESIKDKRIPTNITRKINILLSKISEDEVVELSFSHGDFTQWNMYLNTNRLGIYDWELASNDKPKGFDFFHYTIQKGILVDRKKWEFIYLSLREQFENKSNTLFNKESDEEFNRYLKWYLLVCSMQYLIVYANQPKWHMQIDWLLQTWNEALDTFLIEDKNSRESIIMDLFDCIHNQPYATIKFANGYPEKLSELSDIDIIIDKKLNNKIVELFTNHFLISKITFSPKSYMNTIQIVTNQGDFLSVDLIWKLKVKNLVMLDTQKVIESSYRNMFGVKTTSALDTARYVGLFYILNNAKIPEKYLVYEDVLTNSKSKLDSILKDYFIDENKSKNCLLKYIRAKKENKKFRFLKNTWFYILDTFRGLFHSKGFIITFSGVDGAGKSTIIENIRFQIEKQLRKRVIVLRHRPSILPILSVWTKGKEQAHLDAVSNLPRQGKNSSMLSSIFRFGYYYLDYVIGQFVVYFKYILRGYVVIYDRYYFDFINDSKRSNIVLPQWVSKFGYNFLLKPKFNFFLFADTETILARKKELSGETIEKLNNDYQLLFKKLESKNTKSTYKAIKNEKIESTLQNILTTIKSN